MVVGKYLVAFDVQVKSSLEYLNLVYAWARSGAYLRAPSESFKPMCQSCHLQIYLASSRGCMSACVPAQKHDLNNYCSASSQKAGDNMTGLVLVPNDKVRNNGSGQLVLDAR
jgi:hypothetical protein